MRSVPADTPRTPPRNVEASPGDHDPSVAAAPEDGPASDRLVAGGEGGNGDPAREAEEEEEEEAGETVEVGMCNRL